MSSTSTGYVCCLSNRSELKAERELHETSDTRATALAKLRKLIDLYPGLQCPTDTKFLLQFLRARKFDEQRALQLIVTYYQTRNNHPEIFCRLRPSMMKHVLHSGIINMLSYKDDDGRAICWLRLGLWNHETCSIDDILTTLLIIITHCLEDEETQINGFSAILDFKQFGICKALHILPGVAQKLYTLIQSMPARMKSIHYVNDAIVVGYLFPAMRPVMKEKIVKRIVIHGTEFEDFYRYFSPTILPPELGGTMVDWEGRRQVWLRRLFASEARFVQMEKYGLVELQKTGDDTVT